MFILSLFAIGFLHVGGEDNAFSTKENRDLATFPVFSLESYFNGSYTEGIGRYYNDQFPLRDYFLTSAAIVNPLYLFRGLDKEDDVILFERFNVLDETAPVSAQVTTPITTGSPDTITANAMPGTATETTDTTAATAATTATTGVVPPIVDENNTEGAAISGEKPAAETTDPTNQTDPTNPTNQTDPTDQTVETVSTSMTYVNEIIAENFKWSQQNAENFANTINQLYLECGEIDTYVLIPPSPSQIYLPPRYVNDENDPKKVFHQFAALLDGPVFVDLTDIYMRNKDEYLFFRTDHHWTSLGAYYAYSELLRCMDESVNPIHTYERGVRNGFLGGLYKASLQSPVAQLAASNPDDVVYYFPQHSANVMSYDNYDMRNGVQGQLIHPNYDRNDNLYNIFMGGDMPLAHIQSDVKNGKSVMVVRDSFGHAFLPFMADQFEDVYAVESRYFNQSGQNFVLADFIDKNNIDTLVFVGYAMPAIGVYWTTTNEHTAKMLRN